MDFFGNLIQFGVLLVMFIGSVIGGTVYVESIKTKVLKETNEVRKSCDDDLRAYQHETAKSFDAIRTTYWARTDALDAKLSAAVSAVAKDEAESRHKLRNEFTSIFGKLETKLDKIIDNQGVLASLSEAVSNLKNELYNRRKD